MKTNWLDYVCLSIALAIGSGCSSSSETAGEPVDAAVDEASLVNDASFVEAASDDSTSSEGQAATDSSQSEPPNDAETTVATDGGGGESDSSDAMGNGDGSPEAGTTCEAGPRFWNDRPLGPWMCCAAGHLPPQAVS